MNVILTGGVTGFDMGSECCLVLSRGSISGHVKRMQKPNAESISAPDFIPDWVMEESLVAA